VIIIAYCVIRIKYERLFVLETSSTQPILRTSTGWAKYGLSAVRNIRADLRRFIVFLFFKFVFRRRVVVRTFARDVIIRTIEIRRRRRRQYNAEKYNNQNNNGNSARSDRGEFRRRSIKHNRFQFARRVRFVTARSRWSVRMVYDYYSCTYLLRTYTTNTCVLECRCRTGAIIS